MAIATLRARYASNKTKTRRGLLYEHSKAEHSGLRNLKEVSPMGDRREWLFAPEAEARPRFANRQSPPVDMISHPDACHKKTRVHQSHGPAIVFSGSTVAPLVLTDMLRALSRPDVAWYLFILQICCLLNTSKGNSSATKMERGVRAKERSHSSLA